jgi:Ca2+-binding EF-hand superfamily protein
MTFVRPQRELAETIGDLVGARFPGESHRAFSYFDREIDGTIDFDDLRLLLDESEWGPSQTRTAWDPNLLAAIDTDDAISWVEFECGLATPE